MKIFPKNLLFSLILLVNCLNTFCQTAGEGTFFIDGIVSGYFHDPTKRFLQKDKPITLEGTLKGVNIDVYDEDIPVNNTVTNIKGEFQLKLRIGSTYKLEFTKGGHAKRVLLIDLKSIPDEINKLGINFKGAEFILNSYRPKDTTGIERPFGKLFYDARKKAMRFEPILIDKSTSKQTEEATSISLIKRAINKNQDNFIAEQQDLTKSEVLVLPQKQHFVQLKKDSTPTTKPKKTFTTYYLGFDWGTDTITDNILDVREKEVANALEQLRIAKQHANSRADSLSIEEREMELIYATGEIVAAKKIILIQNREIRLKRKFLIASACCGVVLIAFLLILFIRFKEKKRMNVVLNSRNKKITDSINYAKHIQQSVLPQESEIRRLLPDLFIYYEPLDIVSGDFYWFSVVDEKIVIAAIDCTGHGVPGAFMSLIGSTLLNEIINEKRVLKPSAILNFLHAGVLKTLHQSLGEVNCQDGMEMSLCVIDPQKKVIEYAGAMNPLYVITENNLFIINADVQAIGGVRSLTRKSKEIVFTDKQVPINGDTTLYLFTDGYLDQFGGKNNKKFNVSQFKKLLLDIKEKNMDDQKTAITETMRVWKGNNKQTDDMLIIGVKLSDL